jgi:hypothetical protein
MLLVLAGCWRGSAPAPSTQVEQPLSFVVRVNGLTDLERRAATLAPRLAAATDRFLGLADEAQRDALRDDLRVLAEDVAQLVVGARTARTRGDNAAALDQVDRKLADAFAMLAKLRHGLRYANTLEQLQAYQPVDERRIGGRGYIGVADFNPP